MTHTPNKRRWLAALAVGVVALTSACGGDDAAAPGTTSDKKTKSGSGDAAEATSSIEVKGFKFSPKAASVKVGEEVTWTNEDTADHSVVDKGGAFSGTNFGSAAGTKTFTRTYDKPGTFPYFCGIHVYMTGTITVT